MTINSKWQTVCVVGFSGSVSSKNYNPSAHGGVTLCQARRASNGILGRKINSNGRHQEKGEAFEIAADELAHWNALEKASR